MKNLLVLTNELNYADGVSSHLYYLLTEIDKKREIDIFLMCSEGDSTERFRNSGLKVFEDRNLNHKLRSIKNFSNAIMNVLRFCRQNKIKLVHSHNHYAAAIAGKVSKFSDIKTIQTIHGILKEGGRLKHFNAERYIAVSEPIVKYLINRKIASAKNVKLIRHGFPVIGGFKKEINDKVRIICASRLVNEKGIDNFIRAAGLVKQKYKGNVEFIIAGTGEAENKLKLFCKDLNVDIAFYGKVKNIIDTFQKSDIFVLPTRSQSEGFPMSMVEAAFTGNLIIAPEFDWLDNVFANGVDGLTFAVDDYKDLSDRILFALNSPVAANQMAENFRSKAGKLFNIQTSVDKHLELYSECLTA